MAYGDAFHDFLVDNQIPANAVTIGNDEPFIFLESHVVQYLVNNKYATDASNGGLVIGRFHTEGGVHVLTPYKNGFKYVAEMEGYEYLVNPVSTTAHHARLDHMNNSVNHDKESNPYKFTIPKNVKTIDLTKLKFDIIIIPNGSMYILNRTASERHLKEIDDLNDRRAFKNILRLFGI